MVTRSPSKTSRDITYIHYTREFGGIVDVPRVAEALGLKPEQEPKLPIRYTTNDSYYARRLCNQLTVEDGASSTVLVDLEKHIPQGRREGEIREDLHLMVVLDLLLVGDFDQDGREDALVELSAMGSCCEPCYHFATVPKQGKPVLTHGFCGWWGPPLVEWSGGKATFSLPEKDGGEKSFMLTRGKVRRAP